MIQNYLDFNPIRKKIIKSFERVSESVNEYNTFDPNLYIYDYFAGCDYCDCDECWTRLFIGGLEYSVHNSYGKLN